MISSPSGCSMIADHVVSCKLCESALQATDSSSNKELVDELSWTALLSDGKRCFFGPRAQLYSWPGVKPREMVTPIIKGPTARPFIKLPGRWPCSNLRISSPGLRPRRGKLLDLWSAICGFKTTNWRCPISHYSETPCFRRKTQNVSPLRMMEPLSSWQYAGTNAKGLPTNAR